MCAGQARVTKDGVMSDRGRSDEGARAESPGKGECAPRRSHTLSRARTLSPHGCNGKFMNAKSTHVVPLLSLSLSLVLSLSCGC